MAERALTQQTEERVQRTRKRWDAALLLPAFGALLFLTPFLSIFLDAPQSVSRVVFIVFGLWACLILAAFLLSRALRDEMDPDR